MCAQSSPPGRLLLFVVVSFVSSRACNTFVTLTSVLFCPLLDSKSSTGTHSFPHASHLKQPRPVVRLYWVDFTVALPSALSVDASSSPSNRWRFFASRNRSTWRNFGVLSSYIRYVERPPLHSLTQLASGSISCFFFRFSYSLRSRFLVSGVKYVLSSA
jgi:hypothetical protein